MIQQIAVQQAQAYTANQGAAAQKAQSKDTKNTFKSIMKSAAKDSDKKADTVKDGSSKTVKTEKEETKEQSVTAAQQNSDLAQAASAVSGSAVAVPAQNAEAGGAETVPTVILETVQSTQAVSVSSSAETIQAADKSASQGSSADTQLTAQQTAAQVQPEQTAVQAETVQTVRQAQTEQVKGAENFQTETPQATSGKTPVASDLDTAQVVTKETQAAQTVSNEANADETQPQKAGNTNLQPAVQNKADSSTAKQEVETGFQSVTQVEATPESAESAGKEKDSQSAFAQTDSQPEKTDNSSTGTAVQNVTNLYGGGNVVVKVSDTPAKAETSASRQVADTVSYQLKNGKQEFQMNLFPQSLGKVSVKLTTENGILTVEIAASNPKTQSLLIANSGDIKSLLQTSTGQQVQVVKQEQASQWHGQSQDGGYGGQQGQQQQEQQQDNENQNRQAILYDGKDSNLNTGDFLSMMRQLSENAH